MNVIAFSSRILCNNFPKSGLSQISIPRKTNAKDSIIMPHNRKQTTAIDNALASRHLPGLDGVRALSVVAFIKSHVGFVPIENLGVNSNLIIRSNGFI